MQEGINKRPPNLLTTTPSIEVNLSIKIMGAKEAKRGFYRFKRLKEGGALLEQRQILSIM